MKKRFYSLWALGLALCLTLAMPATSLALIYNSDSTEPLPVNTELPTDTKVYADKAGSVTYQGIQNKTEVFQAGYFPLPTENTEGYV